MRMEIDRGGWGVVDDAHSAFVSKTGTAENFADATLTIFDALRLMNEKWGMALGREGWGLIARGIVRGAVDLGVSLEPVGHGMMLGAIRSVGERNGEDLEQIKIVSGFSLQETIALGGDVEAMASGLAGGAVEGSREVGIPERNLMIAAAEGAHTGMHNDHGFQDLVERAHGRPPALVC